MKWEGLEVGLFTIIPQYMHGPAKVSMNLILGLRELGVGIRINQVAELTGCLNSGAPQWEHLPPNTLIGPNIMIAPSDHPFVWEKHRHHLFPSQWIIDEFKRHPITSGAVFHAWTSGIDTDRFHNRDRRVEVDCLVYLKHRNEGDLEPLVSMLEKRKLSYEVVRYGAYREEYLFRLVRRSAFGILLTGTESQGIAVMEMLSSGLPLLVSVSQSEAEFAGREAPARRVVPYFSDRCGRVMVGVDDSVVDQFLNDLSRFSPRDEIVENFSLQASAREYLRLLEVAHGSSR